MAGQEFFKADPADEPGRPFTAIHQYYGGDGDFKPLVLLPPAREPEVARSIVDDIEQHRALRPQEIGGQAVEAAVDPDHCWD